MTVKQIEHAIIERGFAEGWITPAAAGRAHRQAGGGRRFRPRRARLRGSAQQGRALGDGLRARRPDRRAADVRHPQHEARQGRRAAPRRPDDRGRRRVRHQHRGREGPAGRASSGRSSTRSCSAAARPGRATCPSRAATSRASTSPSTSCAPTPAACWAPMRGGGRVDLGPAQGRGRDRRRRHGHRLRRHVAAPRLREPRPVRDHGPAARHPAGRQPVARVAANLPHRLRPGGSDRQSSAATRASSRSRPSASSAMRTATCAKCTRCGWQWEQANGRPSFREIPGTEQRWPAHLVLLAMGFLGPENTLVEQFGARAGRPVERAGRVRASSPPACPASLRPATCAAGRAWWCGRSTKAAARRAECDRLPDGFDAICRENGGRRGELNRLALMGSRS